jgi:hypothetical protein
VSSRAEVKITIEGGAVRELRKRCDNGPLRAICTASDAENETQVQRKRALYKAANMR